MMLEKNLFASESRRPITCIIADGVLSFAGDFSEEKGIPLIYFSTISACSFWAYLRIPELIEAGEISVKGIGMDQIEKSVPGMEGFLRYRDLPSFCRVNNINDPKLHTVNSETSQTTRAQAVILNTFEDIEGPIVSHIRKHIPRLFTIGPNHSHLKSRLAEKTAENSVLSASFWAEDRSCLDWFNAQPPKSVIYVSFGSITVVSREQLLEFWHGLVNSGQRFLWVMRPDSIVGEGGQSQIPKELEESTKARGYMVGWAPQEEVLNHEAVGGFLTHCGWNSTLESIVAGVPMICWPYFADQTTNSRFVSEVWKIGLDMKDTCDREIIEKVVREIMEERKEEFLERAENMAILARKAVREGGSSYCNLDALIDYIKTMII
ncbi:UDP-glycosyltransferase 85A3 [Forsythia ovata]|uniref:UDP-glycosyltransferase 85A3 n=1 Tax=Forsythia ovata TaxID=205694 RepID=A0ABD1WJ90_9LAMI